MGTEVGNVRDEQEATGLVRLAIDKGVDVEVLERLVALQERVTERNARAAYFEALAAVQEAIPEVRKSREAKIVTKAGGTYSYTFAPLEEITRAIRPHLKKAGLSYSWSTKEGTNAGTVVVTCTLRHVDGHSETSDFPVPTDTKADMSGAQRNGAAMTYGKRQSLVAVLGLTTADEDTDGAEPSEFISYHQISELDVKIQTTHTDKAKFLEWLGVSQLSEIQLRDYPKAMSALNEKARRMGGE